jgi:hypothetical protein
MEEPGTLRDEGRESTDPGLRGPRRGRQALSPARCAGAGPARQRKAGCRQQPAEFHACYDQHCDLPLHVSCGQGLRAGVPQRSRIDGAEHAAAV